MAELKNTVVNGSLAARGVYENGTALENKYGASLALSGNIIQLKDYKGNVISSVPLPAGSATTPTNSTALSSTSTSLSGTTLTVQASVTPTVSTGWVSSGTAGTVKISGTVPTETKTASASGDITPTSGKLLSKVTVGSGSATPSFSNSGLSTYFDSGTSSSYNVSITPKATVGTAGWISSISNGNVSYYKIKTGSAKGVTSLSGTSATATLSGTTLTLTKTISNTPTVTAGWVTSGTAQNATVTLSGTVPTETKTASASGDITPTSGKLLSKVTVPSATPAFDGGAATIKTSSTSATASGLTITDTDTDPGSGIYISTSGSATPTRAAVLYNGAVAGWVSKADNASALAAADGSATTLTGNKYFVTAITVPSEKTLTTVTNNGTISTMAGTGTVTSHTGSTTITTNTGTVSITNPSTGTVNYKDWTIKYNSTNKSLEFIYNE